MLTELEMKTTATNLRKMASDPQLKKLFSSETRKLMNDTATRVMLSLRGDLDRSASAPALSVFIRNDD